MDERVLGDVPSEGSEGGRRFGIYRAHSPDPKMNSISKVRLAFVIAIAAVVTFAVFFPMIQYASRASKKSVSLQYPGFMNRSMDREQSSVVKSSNCSASVFTFGHDCKENFTKSSVNNSFTSDVEISVLEVKTLDNISKTQISDLSSDLRQDASGTKGFKVQRSGRSRWPKLSTPYPYYNLQKPTPSTTEINTEYIQQTNIFAIPSDLINDNFPESHVPRVHFTSPPYVFTPYPNFTDSYAQLSPYKAPKNSSNLEEVIRYLKMNGASDKISQNERSENVLRARTTTMRVNGTYIMPFDKRRPGEIIVSGADEDENGRPYNGHAYVTDPFLKFRPSNPLEINRLIPIKSGLDTGPRFRKPISFVPTSSIAVDIIPPRPPLDSDLQSVGSHTVAIFHSPPTVPSRPPLLQKTTTTPTKEKTMSVTLDIYPVTMEIDSEGPSTPPGRDRGRFNSKWRPKSTERPRWKPQAARRPVVAPPKPPPDNHMVLHLNLYPNKRKSYSSPRRSRVENSTQPYTKTTIPGGQFLARSSKNTKEEDDEQEITTALPDDKVGDQKLTNNSMPPGFAALSTTMDEQSITLEHNDSSRNESNASAINDVNKTEETYDNNNLGHDRTIGNSSSPEAEENVAETTNDVFEGLSSNGNNDFGTTETPLGEQTESTFVSST